MATHIVVMPYPAQSHLFPLLHLCDKLASNGVLITITLVESMYKQFLQSWKNPQPNIHLQALPFDFNIPFGYDANVQANLKAEFHTAFSSVGPAFELLFRTLDPPPVCIISDESIPWNRSVAKNLGVRRISYWPGSASWISVLQHVDLLGGANGDFPLTDSSHGLIDYLPGLSPLRPSDLPDYCQYIHDKEVLVRYLKLKVEDAAMVIINSIYELEPRVFDVMRGIIGPNFLSLGPLFSSTSASNASLRAEHGECLKWLDSQEPGSVLYISLGSCSSMEGTEPEEFVEGLAASERKFLWVLNNEVVTDEGEYKRCQELKDHGRGMILPWVPQLKVLGHESVGGFISHCGWNSVMESICCGVPVLCFPRHSDQPLNSKLLVEDLKIGMRLMDAPFGSKNALERAKVASVIQEFMNNQEIRINVKKLQAMATEATQSGGSSSTSFEALLATIKNM